MAKHQEFDDVMDNPLVSDATKNQLFKNGVRSRQEEQLPAKLDAQDYRLMHRGRAGQYWLISKAAMTLTQIEQWLAT